MFCSIFDYFRSWYLNNFVDSLLEEYEINASEYSIRVFRERAWKINNKIDIYREFLNYFYDQI